MYHSTLEWRLIKKRRRCDFSRSRPLSSEALGKFVSLSLPRTPLLLALFGLLDHVLVDMLLWWDAWMAVGRVRYELLDELVLMLSADLLSKQLPSRP